MPSENPPDHTSEKCRDFCSLIEDKLTTEIIGSKIICFESLPSTNEFAKKIAIEKHENGEEYNGILVIAFEQTEGKGRLGRSWHSPKGGIWLSILLDAADWGVVQRLSMISGIATADTLKEFGIDAKLKWPNDVIYEGKKLAGILCETISKGEKGIASIIGLGVNLNVRVEDFPNDIRESSISVADILGEESKPEDFIVSLAENFEKRYNQLLNDEWEIITDTYSEMLETLGKEVRIETNNEEYIGTAIDVTDTGALVVDTADGLVTVRSGECKHLREIKK
jgi:BirA family biotin operon repressor/biotin-[acetyl-CoA-carboxylase] ligase